MSGRLWSDDWQQKEQALELALQIDRGAQDTAIASRLFHADLSKLRLIEAELRRDLEAHHLALAASQKELAEVQSLKNELAVLRAATIASQTDHSSIKAELEERNVALTKA